MGVTLGETTMGRAHAVWNAPCLLLPDFISFVDFPFPLFCPVCQRDGPAFSLPPPHIFIGHTWQLCALCPLNWNCRSHLPFPQAPQNVCGKAGCSALLKTGSGCPVPGLADAAGNDLPNCGASTLQALKSINQTNKQKHQQQKTFGMNNECTGLAVFEMEASEVPFGDQG